jgi:hypothetical protein
MELALTAFGFFLLACHGKEVLLCWILRSGLVSGDYLFSMRFRRMVLVDLKKGDSWSVLTFARRIQAREIHAH